MKIKESDFQSNQNKKLRTFEKKGFHLLFSIHEAFRFSKGDSDNTESTFTSISNILFPVRITVQHIPSTI